MKKYPFGRPTKENVLTKMTEDRDFLLRQNEALKRDLGKRDLENATLKVQLNDLTRQVEWHRQMNQTLVSKIPGAR